MAIKTKKAYLRCKVCRKKTASQANMESVKNESLKRGWTLHKNDQKQEYILCNGCTHKDKN